MRDTVRIYYRLTKPGIIYGNALAAIGGFLLASKGQFDLLLFAAMLAGSSLVIASGCVFNNYLDREIDAHMARTKKRALVSGRVSGRNALIYATILGLIGFTVLAAYTNWLTVAIGLVGIFFYVIVYGFAKRRSVHGTLVGTISGATPPVAGYCAVTGRLDLGALLLFLILVFWQMPHFYAIAIYRSKDYAAAKLPVLPVVKGLQATKIQMLVYVIGFMLATALLTSFGYTGYAYLVAMMLVGFIWLKSSLQGFSAPDSDIWAHKMFKFSLVALLIFCLMISVDNVLA